MRRNCSWTAVLAMAVCAGMPPNDPVLGQTVLYIVEDLGTLGGPINESYDIAPNDDCVGRVLDATLAAKATSWSGGVVTNLNGASALAGEAHGISSNGLVAGSLGGFAQVWVGAVPTPLDPLASHIASRAWDVNASAMVVGWSVNNVGDPTAAKWIGGVITALDVNHSWAFRVNDAGQIVGRRDVATGREARLWHNGRGITLPDLGANFASATNITPRGIITGGACQPLTPTTCALREVIWIGVDHDVQILPTFPGALLENVWSANDRGIFVGEYAFDLDGNGLRALIWRWPDLAPIDMNTLIDPASGWTLQSAQAINQKGSIVGFGIRQGLSGRRAYIARHVKSADITHDSIVNVQDLLAVITTWGPCAVAMPCPTDIDGDGSTSVNDLLAVITTWG